MKYLSLILLNVLMVLNVACGEVSENALPVDDGNIVDDAIACMPQYDIAIHCSLDCGSGLFVQDHGVGANPEGVRRFYETRSDCINQTNLISEVPTPWISPGR